MYKTETKMFKWHALKLVDERIWFTRSLIISGTWFLKASSIVYNIYKCGNNKLIKNKEKSIIISKKFKCKDGIKNCRSTVKHINK